MQEIILQRIEQKYYEDALNWFFYRDRKVPLNEKHSIQKIEVYEKDRILVIYAKYQTLMFNYVKYLAHKTGWYFYITGAPLEKDNYIASEDQNKSKIDLTYFFRYCYLDNP